MEPWERYPLITHIRKLVRRGAECTNTNYWRVEAGEGFSALHDDEIDVEVRPRVRGRVRPQARCCMI